MSKKRKKNKLTGKPDMSRADMPLPPKAYDFGTPELWQRCKIIKEHVDEYTVRARNVDSSWSCDRYHTRNYINDYQHQAASRLYRDFMVGGAGPRYSGAWPDPSKLPHNKGQYREAEIGDNSAAALKRFRHAYAALNYEGALIVWYVVCLGVDVGIYEQSSAWRKGYGMTRLREALDDLVRFYKSKS